MHVMGQDRTMRGRRRRVLLIEDDVAHARIMRRALCGGGAPTLAIDHITSGEEAVSHLRKPDGDRQAPDYDLILLDVRLPDADGVTVLQWIKSEPSLRSVPVVMVSTSDRPADINRCYDLGANAFVTKPTLFDDFTARLRALSAFWLDNVALPSRPRPDTDVLH